MALLPEDELEEHGCVVVAVVVPPHILAEDRRLNLQPLGATSRNDGIMCGSVNRDRVTESLTVEVRDAINPAPSS